MLYTGRGNQRLHVYSSYLIVVRPLFSQSISCYSTLFSLGSLISESVHVGRLEKTAVIVGLGLVQSVIVKWNHFIFTK